MLEGCECLEEGFGRGGEIACVGRLSLVVEDGEEECSGVEIDADIELDVVVGLQVTHEVLRVQGFWEEAARWLSSKYASKSLHEYPGRCT